MHREDAEYRKIVCLECGWKTLLDFEGVFDWLVRNRVVRRNHAIDDELVYELFHSLTDRYKCPECASSRLNFSVVVDDFADVDERRCRGCGKAIPRKRIECVPDTVYCVSCAEKNERSEPLEIEAQFCPTCGKMMELVEFQEGKYHTFRWVCTSVPPCRYRKK